ncbi:BCAM0308 family protein [Patescibacteria group bacterium]
MAFFNFSPKRKNIKADSSNERRLKINEPVTAAPGSNLYCPGCHSVYYKKAWHNNPQLFEEVSQDSNNAQQCPACQRIKDNTPLGILTLENIEDAEHRQMLINTIENIGERAQARDSQERIMKIEETGNKLEVYTTENQLAAGIGRQIKKAFGGKLQIDFSQQRHHDSLARVTWKHTPKN